MSDSTVSDESYTTRDSVRVRYLGSVVSVGVIASWFGLLFTVLLTPASFSAIGASAFAATVLMVLAATGWVFGVDLLDAWLSG